MSPRMKRLFPGPLQLAMWVCAAVPLVGALFYFMVGKQVFELLLKASVMSWMVTAAMAFVAGLMRVTTYHPGKYQGTGYLDWLSTTHWEPPMPLPFGPVRFVWRDAFLLSAFAMTGTLSAIYFVLFSWMDGQEIALGSKRISLMFLGAPLLLPLATFLVGYNFMLWFTVRSERALWTLCGYLFPLLFFLWGNWIAMFLVLVALTILLQIAHGRSLCRITWENLEWLKPESEQRLNESRAKSAFGGWVDRFGPWHEGSAKKSDWVRTLRISSLITWWVYVPLTFSEIDWGYAAHVETFGVAHSNKSDGADGLLVVLLPAALLAFIRYYAYRAQSAPPVSILGRLRTGQLLIPRFDQIFIAPFCIVLMSIFAGIALHKMGVPDRWILPGHLFVVLVTALGAGPTLESWRLTGAYHCTEKFQPRYASRERSRELDA